MAARMIMQRPGRTARGSAGTAGSAGSGARSLIARQGAAVGLAFGVASMLGAGAAQANPALAAQLRKSTISNQAAAATTVADQLAIRSGRTGGTGFGVGVVIQQPAWCPPVGYGSRNYGNLDDDRLRDGFDIDHYDDPKPHTFNGSNNGSNGFQQGYQNGFVVGFQQANTWNTRRGWNRWNNRFWIDPFPYGIDGRLVQQGSNLSMPAPNGGQQQADQPAPEPETEIDAGRRLLEEGVYDASVERYRRHLVDAPDDFEAMAELAVALAGAKRYEDASAMILMAFDRDPSLAGNSPATRVEFESKALRKIVVGAVQSAHDRDSASAWLLVAVLMQAEDRDAVAMRMLQRATGRGLDPQTGDALRAELR